MELNIFSTHGAQWFSFEWLKQSTLATERLSTVGDFQFSGYDVFAKAIAFERMKNDSKHLDVMLSAG